MVLPVGIEPTTSPLPRVRLRARNGGILHRLQFNRSAS